MMGKQYKKAYNEHKCVKGMCIWCEKEYECLFWHEVKVHNMPYGWQYEGAEYEKEMHTHIGRLWDQILDAYGGTVRFNPNSGYLDQFIKTRAKGGKKK